MKVPCDAYVDSGQTPDGAKRCRGCGWTEDSHREETRQVLRGEHPDSIPDGSGGFMRRPRFGVGAGERFA